MKEYADAARFRGQNGWTKEGWNSMTTRLNNQFPRANFIVCQLKFREQRLKREYFVVKSIVEKSGFGFDPNTKMPTTIDEKWDELRKEQRKWRYKAFPYYDDLHAIYDAEGKGCKRTTDVVEEKSSPATDLPQGESFTQQVLDAAGLNSPSPTLPAPGFAGHNYEWTEGIYGEDVDVFPGNNTEHVENNSSQIPTENMNTLPDPSPMKKARTSKGNDEGKAKRGKETAIEDLVAVRKEELKTYVDVKTKQIESYTEVKMAQMEK
ncbi:hypothetical protein CFC21_095097 [Triticum aestivum]|uniref:Myb/SANT-like domain-containing protein n=2 Tax=Triticum aestivum TaxID=4565 RepID=A0A9R1MX29_WHEAT|nr:hypothetical protein CFC21_095097 [Triticum aestivum]